MSKNDEIKKELEEVSPFLANLEKANPFKVPVNYFDSLSDDLASELFAKEEQSISPERKRSWLDGIINNFAALFTPRYAFGLASLLVLLIAGMLFFNDSSTPMLAMEDLSSDEMQEYVNNNLDDFDEEMIMQIAAEEFKLDVFETIEEKELDSYIENFIDELDESELEELL